MTNVNSLEITLVTQITTYEFSKIIQNPLCLSSRNWWCFWNLSRIIMFVEIYRERSSVLVAKDMKAMATVIAKILTNAWESMLLHYAVELELVWILRVVMIVSARKATERLSKSRKKKTKQKKQNTSDLIWLSTRSFAF